MCINFPDFEFMICRGLDLVRSEKYKHLYCYAVFSSSGNKSFLLADSKFSLSDIDSEDIYLIGEIHFERGEK